MPSPANPLAPLLEGLPSGHAQLSAYLIEHASQKPKAEAAVDSDRRVTFAQLAREVAQIAALLQRLGVGKGSRVAVLAPPSIDFWASFLATTALGGVWLGLNPKHTRAELKYVLDDASPAVVLARSHIADRDYREDLHALMRQVVLFADVPALLATQGLQNVTQLPAAAIADDPALLVYTSGTTGTPKGALLSHRALIRGALVRARLWPVDPFRALNNLPINHIGCVGDIACTTLIAGGCQVFMEKFDPASTLRVLAAERVSFWYQIPTMFQLCLDQPAAAQMDWSHLDTAIWSGGRAPQELITRLEHVARKLAVDYSMTESVGSISLTAGTRDRAVLMDSVGWPDPGRGLRVVNPETLEVVSADIVGEIQLKDAWCFSGYRSANTVTDAFTGDGWFRTGDLALWRTDGTLQLVGRLREMFKSGGYNVYPKEIEQVIEAHDGVATAVVVPVADSLYGEVGVAFVVPRSRETDSAVLNAHCRTALANYKIPKRFVLLRELPMLPTGKIDRLALREHAGALPK